MIATLEAAICTALGALPGVATARPYAGDFDQTQRTPVAVPAVLVSLARLVCEPDPGTGEVVALAYWSAYCVARRVQSPEALGAVAWALAEAVLATVRMQTWGLPRVSPAELVEVHPLWKIEDQALAVREVRWTHRVRLGTSEWAPPLVPADPDDPDSPWVPAVPPETVWLGPAPAIGTPHVEGYWLIAGEEGT